MKFSRFITPRFITAAVCTTVLGAGIWRLLDPQDGAMVRTEDTTTPAESPAVKLSHHWQAGSALAFQCRSAARMEFLNSGLQVSAADSDLAVQGVWHVRVLSVTGSEVTLAAQMTGAELTSAGERRPVIEALLNNTPCVAVFGLDGQLRSTRLPASLPQEDRTVIEGLCASLQCVLPDAAAARWTTTEQADGQTFTCSYEALADGTIAKKRNPLATASQAGVAVKVSASSFVIRPGAMWVASLTGEETATCLMQGREIARTHSSISFTAVPSAELPTALLALGSAASLASFTTAPTGEQSEAATQRAKEASLRAALVKRWEKVPAAEIITALNTSVAASKSHADTIEAMHALRDWLTVHPDKAAGIARSMQDAALPDGLTSRIAHALELAGATSPESQLALAEILTAPAGTYPPGVVLQATAAGGGVGAQQTPELLAALRHTASSTDLGEEFQTSDAALFALGVLAKDNPALRSDLVSTLGPRLALEGDFPAADTEAALYSLANARLTEPELTGTVQTLATNHSDPAVRAAALELLRHTGETGTAAAQHALTDASEQVQRKAVEVLAAPDADHTRLSPLVSLLESPDTSARLLPAVVSALAAHRTTEPSISPAFHRLLARTNDTTLQQQITEAMTQ
jgi:hypothetical protein